MKIDHVMDQSSLRGGGSEIDLERGSTKSEDTRDEKPNLNGANSKKQLYRVWSGCIGEQLPDKSEKRGRSFSAQGKGSSFDVNFVKNEKIPGKLKEQIACLKEQIACLTEKKMAREFPRMPGSTRPPKPPRPPKAPSLDAADMLLVKEISELAILKRKRIEQMKTLHKVKKEKASSVNSSLFAMAVTTIFFIVIICQGLLGSRV